MIETFFLYFFGFLSIIFAIGMISRKHPMHAALLLIGVMISLGAIYGILNVHVVAVFQILIYVGAVMVFMIYVIMLLDDKDSAFLEKYSRYFVPGALSFLLLLLVLLSALPETTSVLGKIAENKDLFTFSVFSEKFITHYLLHFELASLLLLVGVITAVTVIKGGKRG